MEPLSKIANLALDEITNGQFSGLPKLAITGLLNDFQYSWLRRFKIPYKFEMLDIARRMDSFSAYIKKWHKNDDRVILGLSFDGIKINAEWIELKEYLKSN